MQLIGRRCLSRGGPPCAENAERLFGLYQLPDRVKAQVRRCHYRRKQTRRLLLLSVHIPFSLAARHTPY